MGKSKDISGQRFGKLIAIRRSSKSNCGKWKWLCKCDCGNYKEIDIHQLLRTDKPSTKTCGKCKKSMVGTKSYKHGMSGSRLYQCYKLMKNRCYNSHNIRFHLYGGRGIVVCDEWLGENGSSNFIQWALNNGYEDNLTLDRIDNNKGYSPENCRWATRKEQSNNLRTNRRFVLNGKEYTLSQIADMYNINYDLLHSRIRNNWDIEKAIITPNLNNWRKRRESNPHVSQLQCDA